jgi:hypothetical protein
MAELDLIEGVGVADDESGAAASTSVTGTVTVPVSDRARTGDDLARCREGIMVGS